MPLRRSPYAVLLAVFAISIGISLTGCGGPAHPDGTESGASRENRARNVVFIAIDALRADHLGVHGHQRDTTPNLDALAAEGALFTRAYSATSWTLPSLASYMCSVYPTVHGLRRTPHDPDQNALPGEFLTLAESLAANGLHTAAVTSQPWLIKATGLTQGFEEVDLVSDASDPREAEVLTASLVDWLRRQRRRGEPFFLYAHYMGPHSPYNAPEPFRGRFTGELAPSETVAEFHRLYEQEHPYRAYQRISEIARVQGLSDADRSYLSAEYDEKLAYTDDRLGLLFAEMKALGLFEDTLVIVTADHGEAFFEHGTIFHGQHLHEELTHVPLILRRPGAERVRINDVVELIDIYPTVHDALGFPVPRHIQGQSLLPLYDGSPGDGIAFAEGFGYRIVTAGWSSYFDYSPNAHRVEAVRVREIYDLTNDRLEQHNRVDSAPEVARRHRHLAAQLWTGMEEVKEHWRSAPPVEAEIDAETLEKLRSLGYLQ